MGSELSVSAEAFSHFLTDHRIMKNKMKKNAGLGTAQGKSTIQLQTPKTVKMPAEGESRSAPGPAIEPAVGTSTAPPSSDKKEETPFEDADTVRDIRRRMRNGCRRKKPDIFKKAKAELTITDLWRALDLPGNPAPSCRSPFHNDHNPSFSIYDGGRRWKDHSTGEGGDVIDFILKVYGENYADVREWLLERHDGETWTFPRGELCEYRSGSSFLPLQVPKFDLRPGTEEELRQVARLRGLKEAGVIAAADAGILLFASWQDRPCYVITDDSRRATEARALDGRGFGFEGNRKAAPLSGVDKSWLPGADHLRNASADTSVLLVEGATDLLAACAMYHDYRQNHGGQKNWVPVALLGAGCRRLDPECGQLLAGRHVRIVPDGDIAGDQMVQHWVPQLQNLGCVVDIAELPRGKDLSDIASDEESAELFL